ncbi:MAG: hypothetical protein FJY07_14155, partial [Bacteroidetes bacterium]|nr:hypothetical protein [Bacteroidota bacterium]
MGRRNLALLIITASLLVIAAILALSQRKGTFNSKINEFAVQDTTTITRIFLADKNNRTILLERKSEGEWLLNHTYKARNSG